MTDAKLNYIISNGEYCERFLECLARGEYEDICANDVLNHGLAVHALIYELRRVELENRKLLQQLEGCVNELRLIRSHEIDPIVHKRFDELKQSFISFIEEF